MRVELTIHAPVKDIQRPWAKRLDGFRFDDERGGGYALIGEWSPMAVSGLNGTDTFVVLSHVGAGRIYVLCFSSAGVGHPTRHVLLFKSDVNTTHKLVLNSQGLALELAITDGEFLALVNDQACFFWKTNVTTPMPYRTPALSTSLSDVPAARFRNPAFVAGAIAHAFHGVPLTPSATHPAETSGPAAVAQPQPQVETYQTFDKGSAQYAKIYNSLYPLPDRAKWKGQLSGLWLVEQKGHWMPLAALAPEWLSANTLLKLDEDLKNILIEQAALLSGAAELLKMLVTFAEQNQTQATEEGGLG